MKALSDYKGEEAIELWADILEPLTEILGDEEIRKVVQSKKPKMIIAKEILKLHKKEAEEILLRIDPTPIDGLNIVLRLVSVLTDVGKNEEIKGFFGLPEQEQTAKESSGSVMENIKVAKK